MSDAAFQQPLELETFSKKQREKLYIFYIFSIYIFYIFSIYIFSLTVQPKVSESTGTDFIVVPLKNIHLVS